MSRNRAEKTWITNLVKIVIRPPIDGRYGGVRASLEDQVVNRAKSAVDLIASALEYPNGEPVECVFSDLITLASMLRIPVSIPNVDEVDVYRPAAWNAFGTDGLDGADFRACETCGPVYG